MLPPLESESVEIISIVTPEYKIVSQTIHKNVSYNFDTFLIAISMTMKNLKIEILPYNNL